MNTPSHHRVHHATNPQYIDRNHAGILIIWDRSSVVSSRKQEPCVYGLTSNIGTFNPLAHCLPRVDRHRPRLRVRPNLA